MRAGDVVRPREECGVCGIGDGEGEGEGCEVEAEEGEAGRRRTTKVADPVKPREEEVDEHEKTHLPYRSWCGHCVKGRGTEAP